ncbi:delta subunit of the central stalk of mitochondrial F1F0 ATP synthase, atp16 [Recurvomyces mirabilis]|uniref:Delta subunit of the central stalk of mitochondrial F1F0 ATP synthase, atp16 n=1 Tax=Recurvomyces mirabilis TaxID=574656 RepID=A0AAE0WN41_9PEZI|nr:delta subunit of the central stalk of mitochondrial F1F0 ATP synthase, atp16 [Recurvomyces mirabilis]KAK5157719.1 delta subunit of the central stalk of mitochondrial F1F0 ATP synthase, atp16 [Recurvomyces mirabilis]
MRVPVTRHGYADVAPDKIKLSLALPHQAIYKSQDVYVLANHPKLSAAQTRTMR